MEIPKMRPHGLDFVREYRQINPHTDTGGITETSQKFFEVKTSLTKERTLLDRLKGRTRDVAKILLLISTFVAGEGLSSTAYAEDTSQTSITQIEGKTKNNPLPEVVFKKEMPLELFLNDPAKIAISYRPAINLKNERIVEVPVEGQIIFYENSLSAYGEEKDTKEINLCRISHELFHQQFDHLAPEVKEKISDYFSKKYDLNKIKDYLIEKQPQYKTTIDKTKTYKNGENKARQFIINEFIAHAGSFKDYNPNEPEFLIDILPSASDLLARLGFDTESQKKLELLKTKESGLNEEEKNEKENLEKKLTNAKISAQDELRESLKEDPKLWLGLKANAASLGIAYTRFDQDYFLFQASGLGLDKEDLNFLTQNGFDIDSIKSGANTILDKANNKQK